jgi:hypothetical protein
MLTIPDDTELTSALTSLDEVLAAVGLDEAGAAATEVGAFVVTEAVGGVSRVHPAMASAPRPATATPPTNPMIPVRRRGRRFGGGGGGRSAVGGSLIGGIAVTEDMVRHVP